MVYVYPYTFGQSSIRTFFSFELKVQRYLPVTMFSPNLEVATHIFLPLKRHGVGAKVDISFPISTKVALQNMRKQLKQFREPWLMSLSEIRNIHFIIKFTIFSTIFCFFSTIFWISNDFWGFSTIFWFSNDFFKTRQGFFWYVFKDTNDFFKTCQKDCQRVSKRL